MSTVTSTTTNPQTSAPSQQTAHKWGLKDVHETIDNTVDKIGSFIIDAGNLAGGPAAVAVVHFGVDSSKTYSTDECPACTPLTNKVLDIVKIPLSVSAQKSGPAIAETCVKIVMPIPRASAHGSANAVNKSAEYSKRIW